MYLDSKKQHKNSLLDYRFGWRWLMPLQASWNIYLLGFDKEDSCFWKSVLFPATIINSQNCTAGWIINSESPDSTKILNLKSFDNVNFVCIVGSGHSINRWLGVLKKAGFVDVREYGLLPHANPRVVVPLGSRRHTLQGLALHRPGRQIAQFVIRLSKILVSIGVCTPLRRRVLLIANKTPNAASIGAQQSKVSEHFSQQILDYALYLGTPDDNRKTVVLPLSDGMPDTILKSGSSPLARMALLNESHSLSAMQETPLSGNIPLLKEIVNDENGITLYQEYRVRLPRNIKALQPDILEFLSGLSRINRYDRPLNEYLEANIDLVSVKTPINKWLIRLAQQGKMVCEHRGHGDFAPWNVAWSRKGLFVYDWEESRPNMPAFWDSFYYITAPALRIKKQPDPALIAAQCIDFATKVASASGLAHLDVTCHFVIWCLSRFTIDPFYERMLETINLEIT